MKRWCIDVDGVITANPQALSWLTYHLSKNENNNQIYIISWRNGLDPARFEQTTTDLLRFNITYDKLILAPGKLNARAAAYWKVAQIKKHKIDIWLDDEIKIYERDYLIDLDRLLPDVLKIWI